MFKKIGFRIIAVLIIIGSIVAYTMLQKPYPEVTLEDYVPADEYDPSDTQFISGDTLYIYDRTNPEGVNSDTYGNVFFYYNSYFESKMNFSTKGSQQTEIMVADYTVFNYPSFEGYEVVGQIAFDDGYYSYDLQADGDDILLSRNLPVVVNHLYSHYDYIPVLTGVVGALIFFVSLLNFGDNYHDDIYTQGYQRKQRGKHEKY